MVSGLISRRSWLFTASCMHACMHVASVLLTHLALLLEGLLLLLRQGLPLSPGDLGDVAKASVGVVSLDAAPGTGQKMLEAH